jgi:Domain of unknown function (DUF222)
MTRTQNLQRAQSKLTAINASVLAAFAAQSGYEPDAHRSAMAWLTNRTRISRGAAAGAVGWQRRLARHGVIAAAMAGGHISESWAKDIATWTDPLPPSDRDAADQILLEAAAAGVPLEDLKALAESISETWKARHPDPDDGNGDDGDEDGFGARSLWLASPSAGPGGSPATWRPGARPSCRRSSMRSASTWGRMTCGTPASDSTMRWTKPPSPRTARSSAATARPRARRDNPPSRWGGASEHRAG